MPTELSTQAVGADRRFSIRFSIDQDIRYKEFPTEGSTAHWGVGKVLNMSSAGVLFTTESALPEGLRVELAISWPAKLNSVTPLKLVIVGRVVRSEERRAAIAIARYDFKTQGSRGL